MGNGTVSKENTRTVHIVRVREQILVPMFGNGIQTHLYKGTYAVQIRKCFVMKKYDDVIVLLY